MKCEKCGRELLNDSAFCLCGVMKTAERDLASKEPTPRPCFKSSAVSKDDSQYVPNKYVQGRREESSNYNKKPKKKDRMMSFKKKAVGAFEQKIDKYSLIISIVICLLIAAVILVFAYQISEKKNEDYIDDHTFFVNTYVCYVTDYGSKYHAEHCQYLYNSSNKTNVYRAKMSGYTSCSKCEPNQKIRVKVFDSDGDTPPMETKDVMASTCTILVFAVVFGTLYLRELIKKIYFSRRRNKLNAKE